MIPPSTDTEQPSSGPWSTAALTVSALDDLRTIAEAMHRRERHPDLILHALAEQAAVWHRRGAPLDDQDVLRAVRAAVGEEYRPFEDLEHALLRDRIAAGIAAMQQECAGAAYRDGYMDAQRETREAMIELIREVVAKELPGALRALGVRIGGTAA